MARTARALLVLALAAGAAGQSGCGACRRSTLPAALSDAAFRDLMASLAEPAGSFTHSDNLVSNEAHVTYTAPALAAAGGVYIGVGPEQNFSYIAALRPAMAFIIDVRAENRSLHLLYKALFEISADRADFVFRLFSREAPADLARRTSVEGLFARCASAPARLHLRDATLAAVTHRLTEVRGLPLSARDLEWMEFALAAFHADGPDIHYARSRPEDAPGPSYRTLMTTPDVFGEHGSFLATEESFAFIKGLHERNMIVPVVGDFGGTHAVREAGAYVRQHRQVVRGFYASNVEVYLNRVKAAHFCANLASLPVNRWTVFIGGKGRQSLRAKLEGCEAAARRP